MALLQLYGHCDRCAEPTKLNMMSMFNTEMICYACREQERAHPLYSVACITDRQQTQKGNTKYTGIGLPAELIPK